MVGADQGTHLCPILLPMERKWKRSSKMGAHSLSQLSSPPSFSSLHTAWDNEWMKFCWGNKKERWKRMSFPWWLRKAKCLIKKSNGRTHMTNRVQSVTGSTELHAAVSKLAAKILGLFCGHLTVEGGFVCSFNVWWVTGFVHHTLRFFFFPSTQPG